MHTIWKTCLLCVCLLAFPSGRSVADEPTAPPAEPKAAEPQADQPKPADATKPGEPTASDELDDRPDLLVPTRTRGSREEDRVRALAMFAAARVAEQKQDYPKALRMYERALRLDPEALPALREIVPLAFNLDRQGEAVRYALLMAERDASDPLLLRRLANYLTEEGESERALKLYEKALSLEAGGKPSAALVLLWLEMGRLSFLTKKYDPAAHYFGEVLKALDSPKEYGLDAAVQKALLGKPELTYQLFGEGFLEAGRSTDALAAFTKSNDAKADEALFLSNQARVLAKQKQPAQALAKLDTYLEKHFATQGIAPYQLLGQLLTDLGQQDQFVPRLEKLHEADPENMPLAFFLAQRYREANQLDKAQPIYSDLFNRHKARPPIEAFQGLVDIYLQQKDAAKLLGVLGEAAGRTGNLNALGDSGKALQADEAVCKSVLEVAQKQIAEDPAKLSYGEKLAVALLAIQRKDFATANTFFDAALKADPSKAAEALVTWGLELFIANQFVDAITVFQRGIDEKVLPDNNPTLYFYLAGALEMSGRTDEAIAAAGKAAEMQKDAARFQSRGAWILYHAKRYDAARQSYQALIEKFDKSHDAADTREVLRDARLVLSNISVIEGKSAESEEWLQQVLDEFPEDIGALNDLGFVWADSGKHLERALDMIQVAVNHEPKNIAYRDSLGWVLFRLGRIPEAIAELKVAAGGEDPDGVILDHLAEAQFASGDVAGAVETWNRALRTFEKSADAEKLKQTKEKIARAQAPTAAK